jgi:hypothetical protein
LGYRSITCKQDRNNGQTARARVEILQVERKIIDLRACRRIEPLSADLKLQHNDRVAGQYHRIGPARRTRQRYFKQKMPVLSASNGRQHPGQDRTLLRLILPVAQLRRMGELPRDRRMISAQKIGDRSCPIRFDRHARSCSRRYAPRGDGRSRRA